MKPLKDSELHKTVRIHMQKRLLNVPVGTSDPAYIHHVTQAIVEGVADAVTLIYNETETKKRKAR